MFWIALELSNPMIGSIAELTAPVQKLIAPKFGGVAKCGNSAMQRSGMRRGALREVKGDGMGLTYNPSALPSPPPSAHAYSMTDN